MQLSYPRRSEFTDRLHNYLVRAACATACMLLACAAHALPPAKTPDFDEVTLAAQTCFASQPDYQNGDLISRTQIEAVLKSVAAAGWKINNSAEIMALGLPDNSFLVRELSAPRGKKFMRKVAAQPGGYAHLDRLSSISGGETMVRYLISKPGGDEMITYLATTEGGNKLGKMMGGVRDGVDLNKPTRRIYTANELLAVLQQLHQKSAM
jgi:hypothetical protein